MQGELRPHQAHQVLLLGDLSWMKTERRVGAGALGTVAVLRASLQTFDWTATGSFLVSLSYLELTSVASSKKKKKTLLIITLYIMIKLCSQHYSFHLIKGILIIVTIFLLFSSKVSD